MHFAEVLYVNAIRVTSCVKFHVKSCNHCQNINKSHRVPFYVHPVQFYHITSATTDVQDQRSRFTDHQNICTI